MTRQQGWAEATTALRRVTAFSLSLHQPSCISAETWLIRVGNAYEGHGHVEVAPHPNLQLPDHMSHLYILTDAETEAVNGGFFKFVGNNATVTQSNGMIAVPVATGGLAGFGLLGLAGGGIAGILAPQTNYSAITQTATSL